ncbi:MAG: hypothetical protein AB1461_21040 [Thermodesulfobacteriota bacterium]
MKEAAAKKTMSLAMCTFFSRLPAAILVSFRPCPPQKPFKTGHHIFSSGPDVAQFFAAEIA